MASLAKWLSVRLWSKWLWVRVQLQSREISNNWPNDLLGSNHTRILNLVDNCYLQYYNEWTNISSAVSKWGTFLPFSSIVILHLVLPSNFIVLGVKGSKKYLVLILNVILFSVLFTYIKIFLNIWYGIWFIR